MQPVRPERLSQIEAERPATSDLGRDPPKPLRRHVAERRRDELGARFPIRREAPPLVTFADSRPLPEVLGIAHWDMRYRRPERLAPGAGVDIYYGYRAGVQSFELAIVGAALTAGRKYKLGPAVARDRGDPKGVRIRGRIDSDSRKYFL